MAALQRLVLPVLLLGLLHVSTALQQQQQGRQGHPMITSPAKLAVRQGPVCDLGNTMCPDKLGCCPSGSACAYTSYSGALASVPICDIECNESSVTCGGVYSGLCCPAGSSCDYRFSGLCTGTKFPGPPPPPGGPPSSPPSQTTPGDSALASVPTVTDPPPSQTPTSASPNPTVSQQAQPSASGTATQSGNAAGHWMAGTVQYVLAGVGGLLAAI